MKQKAFHSIEPDCTLAIRLPSSMMITLERACRDYDANKSQIARRALREFFAMNDLAVDSPGSVIDGPPSNAKGPK